MSDTPEFVSFPKIPRLSRPCVITEKIDGTNAVIHINPDDRIFVGSRNKWITPEDDNFGFARWVRDNETEIRKLGYGTHHGEWWGAGIQRRYGQKEKRFSLFNTHLWNTGNVPACCSVVPILYAGPFVGSAAVAALNTLDIHGSAAAPGFMDPEGIVLYHTASGSYFKQTIKGDDAPKGRP